MFCYGINDHCIEFQVNMGHLVVVDIPADFILLPINDSIYNASVVWIDYEN